MNFTACLDGLGWSEATSDVCKNVRSDAHVANGFYVYEMVIWNGIIS